MRSGERGRECVKEAAARAAASFTHSRYISPSHTPDTYPLSNLICPWCAERAKPGRGKPVLIMHIDFFTCFHAISLERSRFSKVATLVFTPCSTKAVGIAHKLPRSL